MGDGDGELDRRKFLRLLAATPLAVAAGLRLPWPEAIGAADSADPVPHGSRAVFPPTPECGDDDEPTPAETAGPFYKPRSPLRASLLEPGIEGTKIVLTGRVFSRSCRPLPRVLVDFWHADDTGDYDNEGFRLRGHQFTDANGRYRLETIVPGLYPGRTRHFHVRVQPQHGRILTTQLYFPDEPRNARDGLFRPELLVAMRDGGAAKDARFHFLLDVA